MSWTNAQRSMCCPECGNECKVIETRSTAAIKNALRRRRECVTCGHRFVTVEKIVDAIPRKMPELKKCPFCGDSATLCTVVTTQYEMAYVVRCDNPNCVMASGGTLRQTMSQAIDAWNRRPKDENTGCL